MVYIRGVYAVSNGDGLVNCNHSVIQFKLQVKLYGGVVTFNHTISTAEGWHACASSRRWEQRRSLATCWWMRTRDWTLVSPTKAWLRAPWSSWPKMQARDWPNFSLKTASWFVSSRDASVLLLMWSPASWKSWSSANRSVSCRCWRLIWRYRADTRAVECLHWSRRCVDEEKNRWCKLFT